METRESLSSVSEGEEVGILLDPVDFSKLADGVVFEEYGRIRPKKIFMARSRQAPKWWQLWK